MEYGYKQLEIYQIAHTLAVQVHEMTLSLPPFEKFEEGSQLRRSSKSVSSNIVEGYASRRYKNEFIRFLSRAYASCQECLEHLEFLHDTKSLKNDSTFQELHCRYDLLCRKIFRYIQAVDKNFKTPFSFQKIKATDTSQTSNP